MSGILNVLGSDISKLCATLRESNKELHVIQSLQNTIKACLDSLWDEPEVCRLETSSITCREFVSLITSGKIVSVSAQAELVLSSNDPTWVSIGREYAKWLGRGIVQLLRKAEKDINIKAGHLAAQLCGKSFGLGYNDDIIDEILVSLALENDAPLLPQLQNLVQSLADFNQRHFLNSSLNTISRRILPSIAKDCTKMDSDVDDGRCVSGSAALLRHLKVGEDERMTAHMVTWLLGNHYNNISLGLYRAVIATLPVEQLKLVLEKTWIRFGDKLYIKHTPTIQQESSVQILLLCAGYVHRANPMHVYILARSGMHTAAISERLNSSSPRTRFLGMVVGMTMSHLIDKPDMRMTFDLAEVNNAEARWYQGLIYVKDELGHISDLRPKQAIEISEKHKAKEINKMIGENVVHTTRPKVVEIVDEVEDDDDDLLPYGKPDLDPIDDDEDATVVQRMRPTAPVYVRDLIASLQDTENYERHYLALKTAANLIRRKADFGTEVKDRCTELGSVLLSLPDTFELDNFQDMQLEAMIAVLVAQPQQMGPWCAAAFFSGDYSISQRALVLTVMGLGAREMAGFNKQSTEKEFPTNMLPQRLHQLYSASTDINIIAQRLEQSTIHATDTKKRKKIIRNDLAKLVADNFFFPLTGRWQIHDQAKEVYFSPFLLPTYLKTLSIIITSAGSSTLTLPQITSEFWDLVLSMRTLALHDVAILEGVLFSFLTILNINEDKRRLAEMHSRELLETYEWVNLIFERTSGVAGSVVHGEEEERCKTLAAGVLVSTKEVVESYHRLMIGDMVEFTR